MASRTKLLLLFGSLRKLLGVLMRFAGALLRETALLVSAEMIVLCVRGGGGFMGVGGLHVALCCC